jgi:nicotinate-nucleotide adenylyltransferase
VADDEHRLTMLRLALAGTPDLEVSTADLDQGSPSYTADLLVRLGAELGPARLVFLMGNDSLRDLPNWREPRRIAALAELGVAARLGAPVDLAAVLAAVPEARGRVHLVETPLIGISSREIRRRVAAGAPIRFQVPAAVEGYIRKHGLYRAVGGR